MNQDATKTTAELIPQVLARLPEPSNDKRESDQATAPLPQDKSWRPSEDNKPPPVPLRNPWQQRRLALDAAVPGAQEAADAVEAWCRRFARNAREGRVLLLSGPFGCGKTRCLAAARRYVRDVRMSIWPEPWPHPPNLHSVNWADFVREITELDNPDARTDLLEADVMFLDDIGSEEDRFKSGSATRVIGDVLGRIHDEKKFAVITTNIAPDGWKARWDGRVEDRLLRMQADIPSLWSNGAISYAEWRARQ